MNKQVNAFRKAYHKKLMGADNDIFRNVIPSLRYCIASTPRTGSTLLSRMLCETGNAGYPTEYLNTLNIDAWNSRNPCNQSTLNNYLKEIEAHRTSGNGNFGIKIHWRQFEFFARQTNTTAENIASSVLNNYQKIILLSRRDKLSQAISLFLANKSEVFHAEHQSWLSPKLNIEYNPTEISHNIHALFNEEDCWKRFLKQGNFDVLEVFYEDLAQNYYGVSRLILDFLGLDKQLVPDMPMKKLDRPQTTLFIKKYLESMGVISD